MTNQTINKEFFIKNIIGIICGALVALMFFPFITISSGLKIGINGFKAFTDGSVYGVLLLLSPFVIFAVNYISQFEKYKKKAAFIVPAACVLALFLVPGQLSGKMTDGISYLEAKVTYDIGFWLILAGYAALLGLAAMRYLGLKPNKDILTQIKNIEMPDMPQIKINTEKLSKFASNVGTVSGQIKETVKKKASQTKSEPEEIMELLKKLYALKVDGILTEEEFTAKKREFLEKMQIR